MFDSAAKRLPSLRGYLPETSDENMNRIENKSLADKLLSECNSCINHKPHTDTYASPSFMDMLRSPLTIDDIPMEMCDVPIKKRMDDPTSVPWDDRIKNFVMDYITINDNERFKMCILMLEYGYRNSDRGGDMLDLTIEAITLKYSTNVPTIIVVEPCDEGCNEFKLLAIRDKSMCYEAVVTPSVLPTSLSPFHVPYSTLILCHDSSIECYRNTMRLMPEARWSISCTPTSFVTSYLQRAKNCSYVCTVYSHKGTKETRAVGHGPVLFHDTCTVISYEGKLNYYSNCVRGSKHSTGRCYDCKMLYRTLEGLGLNPSPIVGRMDSVTLSADI